MGGVCQGGTKDPNGVTIETGEGNIMGGHGHNVHVKFKKIQ